MLMCLLLLVDTVNRLTHSSCQESLTIERLRELLASLPTVSSPSRTLLNARYRDFYLHRELSNCDFPLHWVFKELSTQVRTCAAAANLMKPLRFERLGAMSRLIS